MSDSTLSQGYIPNLKDAESSYIALKTEISKIRDKARFLIIANGFMLWLAILTTLVILWSIVGGLLNPPSVLRGILMILWSLGIIFSGYFFFVRALFKRISIEQMAYEAEQRFPELQDRLISSIQLWQEMSENKYGYSENLVRMVVEEAKGIFSKLDKSLIIADEAKKVRHSLIRLFIVLIPLVILVLAFPALFDRSVQAFINPFAEEQLLISVEISSVSPGNITIQPMQDVDINAEVKGTAPEEAILHIRSGESEWQAMTLSRQGSALLGNFTYSAKLDNIRQSMEYYVSVMDTESPTYQIKVAQKPLISNLQVEMNYPKYLNFPPQKLSPNVGDISAPVGTRVNIVAESNKDLASAFIVFDQEDKLRMSISRFQSLNTSFIVKKSGTYHISVTDTDELINDDPIKYSINAIADQSPQINITSPDKNVTLDSKMVIQLQADIQDDHGISDVRMVYQIEGQENKITTPLGRFAPHQANISIRYTWDLMPIQLFPEDVVTYYIEATDYDNVSGPNMGRSETYTARFPSLYEIYKQSEEEQDEQQSEMEDILSEQKDNKKAVDDLMKELKKKDQMEWADKKELERVTDMQKKIEEKMQSVAEKVDQTTKKMEENPLINTDILKKVQELRDLINDIANDEMKQIMKKLSESLEKVNLSEQQKDLMMANLKQEELMEKLDRAIKLFKNMQMQQKLEVAANLAKELERQQADTLQKTEQLAKEDNQKNAEAKANELASREERIKNQLDELQAEIDQIVDEMKENNPTVSKMLNSANERSKQANTSSKLQKASDALKCCNASQAMPFQKQALSEISQFQKELSDIAESAKGMDTTEIVRALREAVRKSLVISKRHEEIARSVANIKSDANNMLPKEKEIIDSLAGDQIILSGVTRKVAEQLKELSFKNTAIDTELVWALQRASDGMQRSVKAMEEKMTAIARPIQRSTLAVINSSIKNMLDSIDEMSSNASPTMSMDDYMEQLRQLADQQSQLNQSTQDTESQMRQQGAMPSLQDLLEQLAAEQSMIKEAAERLASKLDDKAETMGSLEEVAREMNEVEKTMREGYVDQETLDRQRRILTRLLDYEKSMKKQDYDKKRESQVGRDYIAEKPSSLPSDASKITQQIDSMITPSTREQWPLQYRELIRMYYKSLSNQFRRDGIGK